MEVNPGYKQTEVGLIPKDWDLDSVENLAHITTGGRNTQDRVDDGQYPFFVRSQTVERINTYSYDGEAVLTAGDGVGTGKVFHYIKGKFDAHQRVYRISEFSERVNGYFFYLYFSSHFYNRIMQMTAKSSVDSVRREMIARMPVPLPPTKAEQEAIAGALSDVDALVESLEHLIRKKRCLKQGAVQELLTGRMRLPGFGSGKPQVKNSDAGEIPQDWDVHALGDEIECLESGVSVNSVEDEEGSHGNDVCILKTSAVVDGAFIPNECKKVAPKDVRRVKINPRANCIVISRMNTPELVGECGYVDKDYPRLFLPDRLWITRFRRRSELCPKWLSYVLSSAAYKHKLKEAATGTSGSMKNISQGALLALRVPWPDPREQFAIANTLSDMDDEIAATKVKLAKARQLKQGMLQELLTGRVRLV